MRVSRLSIATHAALSKHLEGEFASATLTFRDGGRLKVVTLNAWRGDRVAAYEHGVEEERQFDPSTVTCVEVETFDFDLMSLGEAVDLGIVLDADAARRLTSSGSAPGAQAAE